jgi:hypothetical protein
MQLMRKGKTTVLQDVLTCVSRNDGLMDSMLGPRTVYRLEARGPN